MHNITNLFEKKLQELLSLGKPTIAFGLKEPQPEILASLENSKQFANIILVGPEKIEEIENFEKVIAENPEEKLATMLANDEVEGIVRGTLDDFRTLESYEKLTGEKNFLTLALFRSAKGDEFFLTSGSNPEGWEKEEKLAFAKATAEFLKEWEIEPDIAAISGIRHGTYQDRKEVKEGVKGILNQTYRDADWVVDQLKQLGFKAKNWAIDSNLAIEAGCNIIIPPNGMVGNQMFRILLVSGGMVLTASRISLSRPYEDNSRTEKDFQFHVKWLVGLINKRKA